MKSVKILISCKVSLHFFLCVNLFKYQCYNVLKGLARVLVSYGHNPGDFTLGMIYKQFDYGEIF